MKIRARASRLGMVLIATLGLTATIVMTGRSHEEDDPPSADAAGSQGPRRNQPVEMPSRLVSLEITLGIGDAARTEWDGEVSVSEGRVIGLDLLRATPKSTIRGGRFTVGTPQAKVAAKKKKQQQAKKKQAAGVPASFVASLDAPDASTVTIRTEQGRFAFKISELSPGKRTTFLGGEAAVERVESALRLTGHGTEDDFPAIAPDAEGNLWLAYVEYRPEEARLIAPVGKAKFDTLVPTHHGDTVRLRRFDGKTWHSPIDISGHGRDVWRPTVTVDGKGTVWVAWAEQTNGDWQILRRGFVRTLGERTLSTPEELGEKGSDFHVVSTTDAKGRVWMAWQAFRNDNYEILVSVSREDGPGLMGKPEVISRSKANDWSPAIAASPDGGVYVAWDTYDKGNYDVMLKDVARDRPAVAIANSSRFEARASLACDKGNRVWVAYEAGDEQWGKDYAHAGNVANVGLEKNSGFALYVNRTIHVACLEGGKLLAPAVGITPPFGPLGDRNKSVPRLGIGGDGTLWLTLRHHPLPGGAGEVWVGSALAFDGKGWSTPKRLTSSANLIDNRPALAAFGSDLLAVYSTDHRQNAQTRVEDDLYVARLVAPTKPSPPSLVEAPEPPKSVLSTFHPNEAIDVAALRAYRVEIDGKSLRPLRGEFHRHTEVSSHNDQDGLLEDSWRYALDAASHDWMGNGDHDNGFGFEYLWWIIQKNADLHHNPPRFVAAQTYERSVVYPNGHRNVMMPKRGIRPLPRGNLVGTPQDGTPDTKVLYAYLKHFGGICASHTSATDMGTDWRDNDPEVEPVVEIYQGHRHNYEHFGAPRSPTEQTQIGGYEPAGFIWNALEKGYKLGFQSSSDHVSTHLSYAIVYAEDTSRTALIEAFKKRHCYAATDNILLDVRSGAHFMGDTFTMKEPLALSVTVRGTASLSKVHVVRDNKYVFSTEPNGREVKLTYRDDDAKPGETHYYYVRVEQSDGNLAWGSPLWVTFAK